LDEEEEEEEEELEDEEDEEDVELVLLEEEEDVEDEKRVKDGLESVSSRIISRRRESSVLRALYKGKSNLPPSGKEKI
jgi:hypothetical protein